MTVTLNKGGTGEKSVKLDTLQIPDLWHLALSLPKPQKKAILQTWHLAHDLKDALEESKLANADLLEALQFLNSKYLKTGDLCLEDFDIAKAAIAKSEGQQ